MKLLFDANLSYRLVKKTKNQFPGSKHIINTGLNQPAKDKEIWEWAKVHEYIIVTNDEDFEFLSNLRGFPLKVILLRTGNQSTAFLTQLLVNKKDEIKKFSYSKEIGLLEII